MEQSIITPVLVQFIEIRMADLRLGKNKAARKMGLTVVHFSEVMKGRRLVSEKFLHGAASALLSDENYLKELMMT